MASGAKPVGAAAGQRVHAIAAGNKYQNPGRRDGPQYLSDPVGQHFLGGMAAADDEAQGDGGVQVAARHMPDGVRHCDHREPEGVGDPEQTTCSTPV